MKDFDAIREAAEASPVFQELMRMQDEVGGGEGRVDLTRLWRASGRKRNKSPRAWYGKDNPRIVHDGTRPDDPSWADLTWARMYVFILCDACAVYFSEGIMGSVRQDPARMLIGAPAECGTLAAIMAIPAMAEREGITCEDAGRRIVSEVAERTEGLGVFAQETEVAKAQRAIGGVRFIEVNGHED